MQTTLALGPSWLDPATLIESMGSFAFAGVLLVIFAECGLLIGFFLPGDSLLFTLGLLIATGTLDVPLWVACTGVSIAAILGNLVGYWIGYKAGPAVFSRPDSKLFKHEHVERAHEFFERYGARAIVLARFVPIVRTFITVTAGVARMNPRVYATYSTIGGVIWGVGVTLLGYFLGQIGFIRDHIDLILTGAVLFIVAIVVLSAVPVGIQLLRARRNAGTATDDPAERDAAGDPAVSEPS
jgi:membrane protein DedA with SNARE-associated domain